MQHAESREQVIKPQSACCTSAASGSS